MKFQHFDSFEEMFASLEAARKAADARVQPWQAAIKADDYFRQNTEAEYGFRIYGQVLPEEEQRPAELRNYRFCQCYSVACPEGEMGDVHVSAISQILGRDEFEEARGRGWYP